MSRQTFLLSPLLSDSLSFCNLSSSDDYWNDGLRLLTDGLLAGQWTLQ